MTTISDVADLDERIEEWAETEPAHRRAAAWALVEHRGWIDDQQFQYCLVVEDADEAPSVSINWLKAVHLLRNGYFDGSPNDVAILRFCVDLAIDSSGWQSLQEQDRTILLNAARIALTTTK